MSPMASAEIEQDLSKEEKLKLEVGRAQAVTWERGLPHCCQMSQKGKGNCLTPREWNSCGSWGDGWRTSRSGQIGGGGSQRVGLRCGHQGGVATCSITDIAGLPPFPTGAHACKHSLLAWEVNCMHKQMTGPSLLFKSRAKGTCEVLGQPLC